MGATQVTSLHPVKVGADLRAPQVVKNVSSKTIYYRAEPFVSSATNDGSLTENQEVTITNTTWFVAKEPPTSNPLEPEDGEVRVTPGEPPISTAVPANLPGRREIESVNGCLLESSAAGVYATLQTVAKFEKATALKFTTGENVLNVFYFDPKLYEISGRPVTNLTLEMLIMTDNVAPTASFIGGLYKVEKVEGAEKKHEVTVETVVTGSTVEIVTPGAKTATQKAVTFSANTLAAGFYVLGLETITATTAAKSFEAITLTVFAND